MASGALGKDLAEWGGALVDAPVSGGVRKAVDGSLTIMAGGEAAEAVMPVLTAMGGPVFPTGQLGTGHAMKALNNYVSGAGAVAVAAMEALILGRGFGLSPGLVVDILNASTGRNNATEVKLKQFVLSQRWGSGFALGLMAKDIGIADELARRLGLRMEVLADMAHE